MSEEPSTSPASSASAVPIWWPNSVPAICCTIAPIGPDIWPAASGGSIPDIAPVMPCATGSTSRFHTGSVCSIHSARLQASAPVVPAGSSLTSSSQCSASRTASASAATSPAVGVGSGLEAEAPRAMSLASAQFTGPSPEFISDWIRPITMASICGSSPGIWPPRFSARFSKLSRDRSGMPPPSSESEPPSPSAPSSCCSCSGPGNCMPGGRPVKPANGESWDWDSPDSPAFLACSSRVRRSRSAFSFSSRSTSTPSPSSPLTTSSKGTEPDSSSGSGKLSGCSFTFDTSTGLSS
jgi:hypothetical protein